MLNEIDIPHETIESKIFLIRGKKVIMDKDLAVLYGVSTKTTKSSCEEKY